MDSPLASGAVLGSMEPSGWPGTEDELDVLRSAQLFRGLDPDVVAALLAAFTPRTLESGAQLFAQGDVDEADVFVVLSGRFTVAHEHRDGRAVTAVLGPGDMVGELSVFDPGPRTSTVTAVTGGRVAALTSRDLLAWGTSRPHVAVRLLQVLARRLRRTNSSVADLMFVDVAGRVAKALLELAARFGQRHGPEVWVPHGLTQSELGQLVGGSRETGTRFCPSSPAAAGSGWKTGPSSFWTYPASPNGPAPPADPSCPGVASGGQAVVFRLTAAGPAGSSGLLSFARAQLSEQPHSRCSQITDKRLEDSTGRVAVEPTAHFHPGGGDPGCVRAARSIANTATTRLGGTTLARTTTVELIDDIDGSKAAETVYFAVDGRSYEIDLSAEHAEGLRHSLGAFIAAARRAGAGPASTRRGGGRPGPPGSPQASAVRAWASKNGVPVSGRGRIPEAVLAQYTSAQQASVAEPAPAEPATTEPAAAEPVAAEPAAAGPAPAEAADKPKRSRRKRG